MVEKTPSTRIQKLEAQEDININDVSDFQNNESFDQALPDKELDQDTSQQKLLVEDVKSVQDNR